jgi:penicillin-insensitive murein endopeptidase
MKPAILFCVLILIACKTVSTRDLNLSKQLPIKGTPESIGTYTLGCLVGAESLFPNEPGLVVMRLNRGRFWGHPDLIKMLRDVGEKFRNQRKRDILVGDLSLAHGGPTITDHASHNSGLDVDIWLQSVKLENNNLSLEDRSSKSALSALDKDDKIIKKLWGKNEITMIKLFTQNSRVQRVLINPYLKRDLCENREKYGLKDEWLRKIRPWFGHKDHLHVRLICPKNSPDCKPQAPTPPGNGCTGDNFNWWFTDEAKIIPEKVDPYENYLKKMKNLPARCKKLIGN